MHLRRRKTTTEVLMEHVQDLAQRAVDVGEQAVIALAPLVEEAREVAGAAYDGARERVRDDIVPRVRDEYVPRVRDGVGDRMRSDVLPKAKAAAASPLVAAALAKTPINLPTTAPAKQTHRVRNSVLALGVGGGAAYAVNRLRGGSAPGGSSYTPPQPPPRPTAVPDPVPAAPPSSDVSVGADPAPATQPGDGPTMDDLDGTAVYPEVGYSQDQPTDDRRPDDSSPPPGH